MTFAPGQTSHKVVVEVIDDVIPELDEEFSVQLVFPVGGAILGPQSSVAITVLTNDNAYGLIGFAEVSYLAFKLLDKEKTVANAKLKHI